MKITRKDGNVNLDGTGSLHLSRGSPVLAMDSGAPHVSVCNFHFYSVQEDFQAKWRATKAALKFIWGG
jgi:hypothetical protein